MKKYNRLSKYNQEKIIKHFCADLTATQTALLTGFNRNTINRYYKHFRLLIYQHQYQQSKQFIGTVEVDESYFGATRPRGNPKRKRGRGTNKQIVFGVFERQGRVYTELVDNAQAKTLQGIIRGKVAVDSLIISDKWRGYDGLVDVGYDKHLRIHHAKHFVDKGVHINGIESFWSFTKRRLNKFNGVKVNFDIHLKECEWRWNKSYDTLIKEIKNLNRY